MLEIIRLGLDMQKPKDPQESSAKTSAALQPHFMKCREEYLRCSRKCPPLLHYDHS